MTVLNRRERQQIRRAMGPDAGEVIQTLLLRTRAHAQILHRGFWGRLKWLILGR